MKTQLLRFLCFSLLFTGVGAGLQAQTLRTTQLFDANWKFCYGDVAGAEKPGFDDQSWRTVTLPHDWSIEDLPAATDKDTVIGPFSKKSVGNTATGYVVGGTAWYLKHFAIPALGSKKVSVYFDGVYMNSDVWLNGHLLGNHPYGYTAFSYNLTPYLNPAGQQNIIAVRVRNEGRNSRWYSGSGIYRHVWLITSNPIHIKQWGCYITTPKVSAAVAMAAINTTLINETHYNGPVKLKTRIVDAGGKTVAITEKLVSLKDTTVVDQTITVTNPHLWWVEKPYLYHAVTSIIKDGKTIDEVNNNFGIRSIEFSAENGFLLNGKKTLLKGGCMHHDDGPLGSATIDRAEIRKVELFKAYGFNAVRTSHNPPSQQFLDACDRLGLLVIDEAFDQWELPKNHDDYHLYFDEWWKRDINSMVSRDRNHPSIIIWSIGNEIPERVDPSGIAIAKKLAGEVHRLDATRPVTQAICFVWEHKGYTWDSTATAFSQVGIGGYNYQWKEYESDHKKYPNRIMMGTESVAMEALENWDQVEKHPWVIGDFVWTAMDYMGETGIGHTGLDSSKSFNKPWPWYNAYCGDIDLIGGKKPQSWYRDVVWGTRKMAMLVGSPIQVGHKEVPSYWGWPDEYPSWNFAGSEGKPLQIDVYSRGFTSIYLTLNGKKLDEKPISQNGITSKFMVNYQPGVLKAIGMIGNTAADSVTLNTTGAPAHIRLIADRGNIEASPNDLSYVTVEITDANGQVIPDGIKLVHFSLSGKGEIAATGNANPADMASFHVLERRTFRGRCLVIVRPKGGPGRISLKATADGLTDGNIGIESK